MQFGCVLFDSPESGGAGPGWASIEGDAPIRINNIQDLQHDLRWWSNLEYPAISAQRGFRSTSIKQANFLRTRMDHIVQELGLTGQRPNEVVIYLSYLFYRVMIGAVNHYGCDIETIGNGSYLSQDLATQYELHRRPDKPMPQVDSSYQNITYCSGRWEKNVIYSWIRRPRLQHAIDVLQTPVPKFGCRWEPVKDKSMLKNKSIVDYLVKHSRPVLAKVSVSNIAPEVADLIGFGNTSGNNQNKQNLRKWLSHPELLWMAGYADIKVEDVLIGESYQPSFMSPLNPLRDTLPLPALDLGLNQLSISAGILAENYWVALANKTYKPNGNNQQAFFCASASWLRSADRLLMFMEATKIRNLIPIDINNYSVGSMSVAFPRAMWGEVFEAAQSLNLLMPPFPPPEKKR